VDNLAEALNFVANLKDQNFSRSEVEIAGRMYRRGSLVAIEEPEAPRLELRTLTGLVDYLGANVDELKLETLLVQVASPVSVFLRSAVFGPFKQRAVIAVAEPILPEFQFGAFMSSEDFIIGLNAMFTDAGDRDALLADVAAIKIDAGAGVKDDGTSQTVTMEAGARLLSQRQTKPSVTLHPFCTFQEIDQPARQFLFRLSKEGQPGLFVADGEAWRNKAMLDIKAWLSERLKDMHIIA
jgi:hypothetical protein